MVNIAIITGLGGSGKSTFCQECVEYSKTKEGLIIKELSLVDFVKEIAKECGWEGGKTTEDRMFLSDLKIAMTKWNGLPIKKVFNNIQEIVSANSESNDFLFFINARGDQEDNAEIRSLARTLGYRVLGIKIINCNNVSNEVPELIDEINSCKCELEITNNDSLENFKKKARSFVDVSGGLYELLS